MRTGTRSSKTVRSGPWWWIRQTISWLALLSTVALLLAAVIVPRMAGSSAYTVLTVSMLPELPPGTLIITKPVPPSKLRVGDAVTYQIRSGEPDVVTHRITAVTPTLGGDLLFTTQGDANPVPDEKPVQAGQIRGVLWYSIPFVGFANSWLTGDQRIWAVGTTATLLLGYAAFMLVAAIAESIKKRRRGKPLSKVQAP